jgi:hypothetical protein
MSHRFNHQWLNDAMQQARSQHCSLETKNRRDGQIEPICGREGGEAKRESACEIPHQKLERKEWLP